MFWIKQANYHVSDEFSRVDYEVDDHHEVEHEYNLEWQDPLFDSVCVELHHHDKTVQEDKKVLADPYSQEPDLELSFVGPFLSAVTINLPFEKEEILHQEPDLHSNQ